MIKRLFDIVFSLFLLVLLSPLFLIVSVFIAVDSRGGVFFGQIRVGRNGRPFRLLKFRTMRPFSESAGQITVGASDSRITSAGKWLRKYKMDELPQLINILLGQMSVVGPRPEVPRYVEMYTEEQRRVLLVRPGLTDYASLAYFHENELLAKSSDPEHTYINEVMPEKLRMNIRYIEDQSLATDLKIISGTIKAIFNA